MKESYSRRFKSRKIRSHAKRTAPPRSTHVQPRDVSSFLIQQGGRRSWGRTPAARRRGGGACSSPVGLRQALLRRRWSWRGGGLRQGQGVKLPCASPLYIGVEGAGSLPSKSIGELEKVGGKKSHHFLPHRLLSPLFRDLDLIPSGYDLIPSKGES